MRRYAVDMSIAPNDTRWLVVDTATGEIAGIFLLYERARDAAHKLNGRH